MTEDRYLNAYRHMNLNKEDIRTLLRRPRKATDTAIESRARLNALTRLLGEAVEITEPSPNPKTPTQ